MCVCLCVCYRFRYESNHLLDMSADEDNDLPSVKTLLQVLNTQKVLSSQRMFWDFLYLPLELPIGSSRLLGKKCNRV